MSTSNDRVKAVVTALASQIPTVGGIVKLLVSAFWPSSEPDIWSLIQTEVSELVDKAIYAKELEERNGDLAGLKETMRRYGDEKDSQRGFTLDQMLGTVDTIYGKLATSSNAKHLLPFAATIAHLHLTLLREQLEHGAKLYTEANTEVWKKQLEEKYSDYVSWFKNHITEWQEWRESQIEARWYSTQVLINWTAHGEVTDKVTNAKYEYKADSTRSADTFKGVCSAIRQRLQREAVAKMATELTSSFLLHVYLPGQENDKPKIYESLCTLWLGPYSQATLGKKANGTYSTDVEDEPGTVTKIQVREWNTIDGLQFFYQDRTGNFTGDPTGGELHDVVPPTGEYFTGLKFGFLEGNHVLMRVVETCFSGGTVQSFGARNSMDRTIDAEAVMPSSYSLQGVKYRQGVGPSKTLGIDVIELKFGPA